MYFAININILFDKFTISLCLSNICYLPLALSLGNHLLAGKCYVNLSAFLFLIKNKITCFPSKPLHFVAYIQMQNVCFSVPLKVFNAF